MTTAKSCCFIQDKNIEINNKTAKRKATWVFPMFRTDKPSFFRRFNAESESRLSDSSLNPLEEERLVCPKYLKNSSRFSLCCFVIYFYIFVLDKTAGFGCRHLYKNYLFLPAFWIWRQVKTWKLESHRLTIRNRSIVNAAHAGSIEAIWVRRTFQCIVHYWPTWNWNVSDGFNFKTLCSSN